MTEIYSEALFPFLVSFLIPFFFWVGGGRGGGADEHMVNCWEKFNAIYLVCMVLHGDITFPSGNIPDFDLPITTSTCKYVPVFRFNI